MEAVIGYDEAVDFASRNRGASRATLKRIWDRRREDRARLADEERIRMVRRTMQHRGVPDWARDVIAQCAIKHNVQAVDILDRDRRFKTVRARQEAMYLMKQRRGDKLSCPQIARWFNRDHTSVMHGIAKHAQLNGLPALVGYTLKAHVATGCPVGRPAISGRHDR